jgi:DNA-binding transcriptional MerR regulator
LGNQFLTSNLMTEIPNKLYFKIGEVAGLAHVEPFVLRYWQKEFKQLNPKKNNKGQRRYTKKDVELVLTIARLRYKENYTIQGIKKLLSRPKTHPKNTNTLKLDRDHKREIRQVFINLYNEIEAMLELLNRQQFR